jgi:hypothetical protein
MGDIMSESSKLTFGVGIYDADYAHKRFRSVDGVKKQVWACPFHSVWKSMLERCYSEKHQDAHPSYKGCSVDPAWHSFLEFRDWMEIQKWHGNELDKDILTPGNRTYSPEFCIFVSKKLNTFLIDRAADRGDHPLGVHWSVPHKMYRARCCNPFSGKREHLGLFTDPDEAHLAWRRRKHELACEYADMQTDPRIAEALRNRFEGQLTDKIA